MVEPSPIYLAVWERSTSDMWTPASEIWHQYPSALDAQKLHKWRCSSFTPRQNIHMDNIESQVPRTNTL